MTLKRIYVAPVLFAYWSILLCQVAKLLSGADLVDSLLTVALVAAGLPLTLVIARTLAQGDSQQIRDIALRDDLTGLPGRRLFIDRLNQALTEQRAGQQPVTVMMLDLDRFKQVNDMLGHQAGDRLLQDATRRLERCLRSGDLMARFGGDEFTLLLHSSGSTDEARKAGERIVEVLKQPFQYEGREVSVGASVGVCVSDFAGATAQEVVRRSDIALYQAKARGSGRVVIFESALSAPVGRLSLEMDLRSAAERGEFRLLYQPQVDLCSGRIAGFEALLRWRHPQLGLLPAENFVPIAQDIGVLEEIGRWVLRQASRQARVWQELYGANGGVRVSINFSAPEFGNPGFVDEIAAALAEEGLPGEYLGVELTETTLMEDAERSAGKLQELKEKGVLLAISNFGSGYSSLAALKRFPVDSIKLDRSFVEGSGDGRAWTVVQGLITMAHALGISVTAEGVESEEQLRLLKGLGCDQAQGYVLARPLEAGAATRLLAEAMAFSLPAVAALQPSVA